MDWRRFTFDYRLDTTPLGSDLIRIEASREAAHNLVLPPHWREQLDRLNRIRAVHGTTALEGNPLSEDEVGYQLDHLAEAEAQAESLSKEQVQILNAGRAQEWVRSRFLADGPPLGMTDLLRMHEMLTAGSDERDNAPGRLRTHPVVVGTPALGGVHRGAPPADLERLMGGFLEFVNSRRVAAQHPVVRSLLAHFFLVTLHPFGDGNGRVSRLVEAGILFQGGYNVHGFYGLSNYFYRRGDDYKLLLQQSRQEQPFDLNAFVEFGVTGFAAELTGINNFIKARLNRVIYRETLVRAHNQRVGVRRRAINQREYGLLDFLLQQTEPSDPFSGEASKRVTLHDLLQEPYIRAMYRNVTRRTFSRELTRLAEAGFIKFEHEEGDWFVAVDFGAIGKY